MCGRKVRCVCCVKERCMQCERNVYNVWKKRVLYAKETKWRDVCRVWKKCISYVKEPYINIYVYTYIQIHAYMYEYIYIYIHICRYVCICHYIYLLLHIFTTHKSLFWWYFLGWLSTIGWLGLVGSIKLWVSFAKEPYKRDAILQKRPIILSILMTVATPYHYANALFYMIR